jgi:hypothetical protein
MTIVLTKGTEAVLLEESLEEQLLKKSVEKANKHKIFFICKVLNFCKSKLPFDKKAI